MRSLFTSLIFLITCKVCISQQAPYKDSIQKFQKNYVATHEVVKGNDKSYFRFYKIDQKYSVVARFVKITDTTGFIMKTSGPRKTRYFRYGMLYFQLNDTNLHLTIYQSERLRGDTAYKDYLFVPFTDISSGAKSYGGGRYLDFLTTDIKNNSLILDFNKSYNPYCAYVSGFSCPIPPLENDLHIRIEAGEMDFAKKH